MLYSLERGAEGYNSRLHYSLYGGVEYFPNKTLAIKQLLPLAAVPAVAIAILVAIINFHLPALSPQTQGRQGSASRGGASLSRSAVTSALIVSKPSSNTTTAGAGSSSGGASSVGATVGNLSGGTGGGGDNGQGTITTPGTGGDGGGTTTPPVSDSGGVGVDVSTPVVDTSANLDASQPTTPQAAIDIVVPPLGASTAVGVGL